MLMISPGERGGSAPDSNLDTDLATLFATHIEAVNARNASSETIRMYAGRHTQFLTFLEQQGHTPPFESALLNSTNVRQAAISIREHSKGPRGGEHAARALVTTLKTSSAWLADEGFLIDDPLSRVKRPKATTRARMPFSPTEVRQLEHAALDTRMATRDIALIHLLLDTGIRVGGLCSILAVDLDLRERRLVLRLKGGHREHVVYFGSPERRDGGKTTRALKAYVQEREQLVRRQSTDHSNGRLFLSFDGWPLQPAGVRGVLNRLADAAGLKNGTVFPHKFRHSFATMYLVRHPGDETGLRGALGHLSIDQFRVYTHVAHEILAQRAGRVSLSEVWLGDDRDDVLATPSPAPQPGGRGLPEPRSAAPAPVGARIKCRFCGEQIMPDAIKCRFCGEWLNQAGRGAA
jgi:integrase/recombinase XerD